MKLDWKYIILYLWILVVHLTVAFNQYQSLRAYQSLMNYVGLCYQVQEAHLEQSRLILEKAQETLQAQDIR